MPASTPFSLFRFRSRAFRLATLVVTGAAVPMPAMVLYWDANAATNGTGGTGTWGGTAALFRSGAADGPLVGWNNVAGNVDEAVFGGTPGTVTAGISLYANRLSFKADYSLSGGQLALVGDAAALSVASGKTLKLSTALAGAAVRFTGGGTVQLDADERIADSATLVVDGATLAFKADGALDASETVAAATLVSGNLGAVMNESGRLTAGSFEVQSGVITVALAGAGGLRKTTGGTVTINGKSDYSGTTLVSAGKLVIAGSNSLSQNAAVEVDGGTLSVDAFHQTAPKVTLRNGSIAGSGTLESKSDFAVYNGSITANIQTTGVAKYGTGTVTIIGQAELRNGATTVTGGILDITHATWLNTNRVILTGGTLYAGGNQLQNAPVDLNGGRLAPGGDLAVSTLTTGAETWAGRSGFDFNIWNATGGAGTGYDFLSINGSLQLGSATLGSLADLDLKVIGLQSATGGPGQVSNFVGNLSNPSGYSWTFVTTSGGITGFDAGKFTVDTTGFTNPYTGTFSVALSSDRRSLNLVFTPVPEPRTYALLLGAGTLGFLVVRRRVVRTSD